ncbi:hypothetical protein B0H11DRAFT_1907356 [Mycena galericulata]|nr:hypothetical protein B0H11DRAFT_1907356 [Mycena galericulata]
MVAVALGAICHAVKDEPDAWWGGLPQLLLAFLGGSLVHLLESLVHLSKVWYDPMKPSKKWNGYQFLVEIRLAGIQNVLRETHKEFNPRRIKLWSSFCLAAALKIYIIRKRFCSKGTNYQELALFLIDSLGTSFHLETLIPGSFPIIQEVFQFFFSPFLTATFGHFDLASLPISTQDRKGHKIFVKIADVVEAASTSFYRPMAADDGPASAFTRKTELTLDLVAQFTYVPNAEDNNSRGVYYYGLGLEYNCLIQRSFIHLFFIHFSRPTDALLGFIWRVSQRRDIRTLVGADVEYLILRAHYLRDGAGIVVA